MKHRVCSNVTDVEFNNYLTATPPKDRLYILRNVLGAVIPIGIFIIALLCIIKCYCSRQSAFHHLAHPVSSRNCRSTRPIEVRLCFLKVDIVICFVYCI